MNYNLVTNIKTCFDLVRDTVNVPLIYYTHIPTAVISLIIGFLVFKKDKSILGKILLAISVTFSFWIVCSLITWTSYNSLMYMFFWSFFGILTASIYIFSAYFAYVFLFNKDVKQITKIITLLLLLPIFVLTPTRFAIEKFDLTSCISIENPNFMWYYYAFGLISFLIIVYLGIKKYIQTKDKTEKKKFLIFTTGIGLFILAFWFTGFLASYLVEAGLVSTYDLEPYGLLGMTVFMGFLAYLIVKFKAFNIKLLGAQALVVGLVALISSEFFFTSFDNTTNIILISVTVLLSVIFGIFLIESVKNEVKRKEELQVMSDKLAQANDQLRKLDNAKSEFISIASHQLRTPLTAIKGFVSLLLEGSYGKVDAKQEDVLNKVYLSNDRLITLVEDLLNISRIESGRMEFKFAPWHLESICQEVMDTFALRAKEHSLYLEYKKPETPLPEILIDGTKVREVVSNMVDNALKYTPKGGVTLKLELAENPERPTENKGVVRVIVSDTGIGIPPEELPYLFAKFSRGKDTKRLNAGGTGLGLYVGMQMIEQNGGRIWAESDGQNQGSRFIIELPVQQSKELVEKWG